MEVGGIGGERKVLHGGLKMAPNGRGELRPSIWAENRRKTCRKPVGRDRVRSRVTTGSGRVDPRGSAIGSAEVEDDDVIVTSC